MAGEDGRGVSPSRKQEPPSGISARDWRHWMCVRDVTLYQIKYQRENKKPCSVVRACADLGWNRTLYYRAQKNPYVQYRTAEEMDDMDMLIALRLRKELIDAFHTVIRISRDTSHPAAALRATKFMWEIVNEYAERMRRRLEGAKHDTDARSRLQAAVRRFGAVSQMGKGM